MPQSSNDLLSLMESRIQSRTAVFGICNGKRCPSGGAIMHLPIAIPCGESYLTEAARVKYDTATYCYDCALVAIRNLRNIYRREKYTSLWGRFKEALRILLIRYKITTPKKAQLLKQKEN